VVRRNGREEEFLPEQPVPKIAGSHVPNTEKDISGYNIYRREENGQSARINSVPTTMLSFQDVYVSAWHEYVYCISAVDVHGNESAKSPETTAAVP
jgi:hypothetical protein